MSIVVGRFLFGRTANDNILEDTAVADDLRCPACSFSMSLVRVFSTPDDPAVGVYYCRPCDVTEIATVTVDDESNSGPRNIYSSTHVPEGLIAGPRR